MYKIYNNFSTRYLWVYLIIDKMIEIHTKLYVHQIFNNFRLQLLFIINNVA